MELRHYRVYYSWQKENKSYRSNSFLGVAAPSILEALNLVLSKAPGCTVHSIPDAGRIDHFVNTAFM